MPLWLGRVELHIEIPVVDFAVSSAVHRYKVGVPLFFECP